mmetsp:Transcript_27594/g.70288  ORF Transcript_27594/g.70288 Transcript_27594/m.70288 type:complete len:176 (-) Transcript_27594:239-766(-)|eukprot:CAMPEP_0202860804 /NCGR_PEP_ID=MMETSP1391-20130828/2401_1 /ASSEMBLY_ACC=CAM_ASM_000867 /TAXON_ID=1034604 /ORGANISM="Chlamydomonas leiostraca, Strain SAG 11-49" /LENGTH=175 /DNA_ID=CAMNT_0049540061 /DNA_START=112 /DNA_END=639 /DNA_ORIENTATION=-
MSKDEYDIQHMPRKRASGPRFDALPEYRDDKAAQPPVNKPTPFPSDAAARIAELKQPRVGPYFIKYSVWAGGAAVAYTYLSGFRHLMQKNRPAWENTFRQRIFIMTPLIAMYVAGSGLLPIPMRSTIESALQRPAISMMEIDRVDREKRRQEAEAAKAAEMKVSDALADQHIKAA